MTIYDTSQIIKKLQERNSLMGFMFINAVSLIGDDKSFPETFNEFPEQLSVENLGTSCYQQQYLRFWMCFL